MSISTTELPHAVQVPAAVSTAAPPAAPAATDTDEPPMMPATPRLHTPHGHRDSVFAHLAQRLAIVKEHFPAALSAGDFLSRTEMALASCGFQGHNSIAVTNLCRDEATTLLKNKIDNIFGSSFNISGLGACITCGCLGPPPPPSPPTVPPSQAPCRTVHSSRARSCRLPDAPGGAPTGLRHTVSITLCSGTVTSSQAPVRYNNT